MSQTNKSIMRRLNIFNSNFIKKQKKFKLWDFKIQESLTKALNMAFGKDFMEPAKDKLSSKKKLIKDKNNTKDKEKNKMKRQLSTKWKNNSQNKLISSKSW